MAQSTSIEELERKIQAAKEAQAKREAVAARSAGERKAQESQMAKDEKKRGAERPTGKPAAAPVDIGSLVVEVDSACDLRVGGLSVRSFKARGSAVITVEAGVQLIECMSYAYPSGVKAQEVVEVSSGKQTVLSLSLTQAEVRARTAELAASKHFKAVSGDIVSDTRAGVEWTRADNGSKVNWSEAQSYCRKLGGGWNLPTREQLESLQNKDLPGIPCGQATCVVPNQFKLSNLWFWSSEPNGSSEAWGVSLTNGARGSHRVGSSNGHRALCVRRP